MQPSELDRLRFEDAQAVLSSKSCPFADLGPELLENLLLAMDVRAFDAGEHLIREADRGDGLFVILSGTAEAFIHRTAGGRTKVGEFGRGDVVGEIGLLTGEMRTADVVARTSVRALLLSGADFHKLAETHPEMPMLLTNVVARRLGNATYDGLGGKDIRGHRIVRCVGRGGTGVVYEATRLDAGDTVALKMLDHRLLYYPGALQRFRREAQALESLNHASIARLHGSFAAYGTQFLIMEWCEGRTLKRMMAGGHALDEDLVRKLVGQLADALAYIHGRGLIHRDIKPSNIIVSPSGFVKLVDFGLVKDDPTWPDGGGSKARTASDSIGIYGTPAYMAPEQFGREPIDYRVDIYGLACVAYEALTGRPLVEAPDLLGIVGEKLRFSLPPAPQIGRGVTREMHEFLTRGLESRPEERQVDLSRLVAWAGPVL